MRLEYSAVELLRAFVKVPSALVFEDAHAMDEASVSLLARLVGDVSSLPLLVVLTRGPETPVARADDRDRPVIDIQPLGAEAAARLAGNRAGLALARSPGLGHSRTGQRQPPFPTRASPCGRQSGRARGPARVTRTPAGGTDRPALAFGPQDPARPRRSWAAISIPAYFSSCWKTGPSSTATSGDVSVPMSPPRPQAGGSPMA